MSSCNRREWNRGFISVSILATTCLGREQGIEIRVPGKDVGMAVLYGAIEERWSFGGAYLK